MTVARTDALLRRPRPFGVRFEQCIIIIRLDKQAVEVAQVVRDVTRNETGI